MKWLILTSNCIITDHRLSGEVTVIACLGISFDLKGLLIDGSFHSALRQNETDLTGRGMDFVVETGQEQTPSKDEPTVSKGSRSWWKPSYRRESKAQLGSRWPIRFPRRRAKFHAITQGNQTKAIRVMATKANIFSALRKRPGNDQIFRMGILFGHVPEIPCARLRMTPKTDLSHN